MWRGFAPTLCSNGGNVGAPLIDVDSKSVSVVLEAGGLADPELGHGERRKKALQPIRSEGIEVRALIIDQQRICSTATRGGLTIYPTLYPARGSGVSVRQP
jgi:hypothetical protein